jgi:hypothetical protein
MRFYLSGPISNVEHKNGPAFEEAASRLRRGPVILRNNSGVSAYIVVDEVFNPKLAGDRDPGSWEYHMKRDIHDLMGYDAMVLLNNWWMSRGACMEASIARTLKIPVYDLTEESIICANGLVQYVLTPNLGITPQQMAEMPMELWWTAINESEFGQTIAKCVEYGSEGGDLVSIGRSMAEIAKAQPPPGVSERQYWTELGIHFYLTGKVARAQEAFREGRMPSEDGILDSVVYSRMSRRTRQRGYWG